MFQVWISNYGNLIACHAFRRTVSALALGVLLVYLDQLLVVYRFTESIEHRIQICLQSIRGKLNAILQTCSQIRDENPGSLCIALAKGPADNEFCIRINGGPGPDVTSDLALCNFVRDILLLAVAESPALINLNSLARKISECDILIPRADKTKLHEQSIYSVPGYTSDPRRRAHRAPVNETPHNFNLLVRA